MTTTAHPPLIVTKPSPLELALVRAFDAPRHLVWAAYTEPRHVQQWMLGPEGWTMPVCEQDLRPGGAWRYVWRRTEGDEMEMTGEFREVVPMERIVMTERWGGDWAETVNTHVFTEEAGRTTITSTMLFPSTEARDRAAATGMADGAGRSFDLMDDLLATMS
jgi:uncharacterized protein YndB with AHSA1/START domain